MKKYQQPKLLLRLYQAQDVIKTSTLETPATTQGDFFDLDAFNNVKEAGE